MQAGILVVIDVKGRNENGPVGAQVAVGHSLCEARPIPRETLHRVLAATVVVCGKGLCYIAA